MALRILAASPLDAPHSASNALAYEVAFETAWVLAHVTSKAEAVVAPLVERTDAAGGGVVPVAVRCIRSGHLPLVTPALRALGNVLGLKEVYAAVALAQVRPTLPLPAPGQPVEALSFLPHTHMHTNPNSPARSLASCQCCSPSPPP